MSVWRCVLGLVVGLFCSTPPASAIVIKIKDDKKPTQVAGKFVSEDDTTLTIRVRTADDREETKTYPLARIEILHRLDVKRLQGLSRENPKAYRDYAGELAARKDDPEARDTAMRLYLIAAKLAPDNLGSSCLIAMSELASTPAEARKFRALAFMLDPKADPDILKAEAAKPAPAEKPQPRALKEFINALQRYRKGQVDAAVDAAKKEGVEKIFGMVPDKIDQKTFLRWCADATCANCKNGRVYCTTCRGKGAIAQGFGQPTKCQTCAGNKTVLCPECEGTHSREPLPDEAMRTVLRCELWALQQLGGGEEAGRKEAADVKNWSAVLQAGWSNRVPRLSLDTVIPDIDPGKWRYRNGGWESE